MSFLAGTRPSTTPRVSTLDREDELRTASVLVRLPLTSLELTPVERARGRFVAAWGCKPVGPRDGDAERIGRGSAHGGNTGY
jgi:hypothetical protein